MADWVPVQEILPVFLWDDTKARSNRISKGQTIQAITDEKKADGKGVIAEMKDRIKDITETDIMDFMQVKNPHNEEALWKMKRATPARIGIGHVGPRYTTEALLRFRAAHAAANDAVFQEVPKEDVEALGVFEVRTRCSGKREMLLRPDWGRSFDQEAKDRIVGNCMHGPQVQIYFGDGLCAPSIRANIPDLFPTIKYGLEDRGITVGTPFFVRYCRVNTARVIGPLLGAQVTCVLIGERPGLLTAESMSAYIARIGIGHVGPRYTTEALLRFRAAHAAANDAVFQEVPKEDVEALGVFEVRTRCSGKREMLLRPDWGRSFDQEAKDRIVGNCMHGPQVQIYFGDGLCAPSIRANIPDLFPTIKYGLEDRGITVGTPFFVRYCRVNTARVIGPLLGAQVTCVLIGERPGLLTAESMSAYIAYHARADMQDSEYTVVSNISRHGIPPVEAAAHIVDLIADILTYQTSGVAFSALSGQIARDGDPDRDLV